ncbi:MAG: enoyl-CoA hydratase/isomerase family protein, partial [Pseudomonadota bacterium]
CTEIAFRQIRAGAALSFEECMRLEYRLARFCMTHPDFYEGVRATIIDKDGAPAWSPATLAEVDQAALDAAFAPQEDELAL